MMNKTRNFSNRRISVNGQVIEIDSGITVSGLPLSEYERLRTLERDHLELIRELADCATIDTATIEAKIERYKDYKREASPTFDEIMTGKKITDEQQERLEKLHEEAVEAANTPQITIDGNKAAAVILRYAHISLTESERREHGYKNGLPESSRVKIE